MNQSRTVSTAKRMRGVRRASRPQRDRRQRAGDQRRERRIAGGKGDREPDDAEQQRDRPGQAEQHADIGGDAFAAFEAQPDRKEMADERAERRRRSAASMPNRCCAIRTAAVPLSMSPSNVAAASPLLPVRSTLVAPILPEPMVRMSGAAGEPASATTPNGIEPSR